MSIGIPTNESLDDLKAVCESKAAMQDVDPVVARRIQERAAKIKADIRSRGMTNIGVELIREARNQ